MTRFCKDCAHMHRPANTMMPAACALTAQVDPVEGRTEMMSCANERMLAIAGRCGPEGRHFEERTPALQAAE